MRYVIAVLLVYPVLTIASALTLPTVLTALLAGQTIGLYVAIGALTLRDRRRMG